MAGPKPKPKPTATTTPARRPLYADWAPTDVADMEAKLLTSPKPKNEITEGAARRMVDSSSLVTDTAKNVVVDTAKLFGKATGPDMAATSSPTASFLSSGIDALKAAGAAMGAFQSLPTRKDNPELARMQQVYKQNADQGMTAAERINALRMQRAGFLRDQEAITRTAGGGGSAAAVLAASGGASVRADNVGLQIEEADRSARMQNQDRYLSVLNQEDGRNRADYGMLLNNAITGRDAFAKTMVANLQQIGDRQAYDQAGYGTVLAELMKRNAQKQSSLTATSTIPNG